MSTSFILGIFDVLIFIHRFFMRFGSYRRVLYIFVNYSSCRRMECGESFVLLEEDGKGAC